MEKNSPIDQRRGGLSELVEKVLEVLTPQVVVPSFAPLGERGVVVFESVDATKVSHTDEQGAAMSAVGKSGDGLHDGIFDAPSLLARS